MKKEAARFMPEGSKYDLVVQSLSDFIDKATAVRDSLKEYGGRSLTKEEKTIIRCSLLPVIEAVQSEIRVFYMAGAVESMNHSLEYLNEVFNTIN